jgi:methylated-DNA-[protein]-cysteine S-methyltransferase
MSKIKTVIVVGKKTPTYYCYYSSPVGNLLLAGDVLGLSRIQFETSNNQVKIESEWQENYQFFNNVIGQLCEYFDKTRKSFDLKLNPQRNTFSTTSLATIISYRIWSYSFLLLFHVIE